MSVKTIKLQVPYQSISWILHVARSRFSSEMKGRQRASVIHRIIVSGASCTSVVTRSFKHHTGDSTIFGSVPPQFRGRTPWSWSEASQPHERTIGSTAKVPPCNEDNLHLQTSMSSPGFEPRPYGT
ncbi:hypothetical protein TNCV_1219241 [Trichonephila clavipes]|nr:hypothetical protein TNCV_1219241 [Trichonephila clavipes]